MEINVKIEATGLERAMTLLAEAIGYATVTQDRKMGAVQLPKHEPQAPVLKEAFPTETAPEAAAEPAKIISMDEAKKRVAVLVKNGKTAQLKGLLAEYGAGKVSDVPADKLEELLNRLEMS